MLRRLLVLVLLLPLTAGQVSLGQHVMAPVQTVVDEIEDIVTVGIAEARFDGSADEAAARLAALQRFVDGFEAQRFAPESTPAAFGLAGALVQADAIVEAIASTPADLGLVSRAHSACESWQGNATKKGVESWDRGVTAATVSVLATASYLDDMASQLPPDVDGQPLGKAAAMLRGFASDVAEPARDCIDTVAITTGAEVQVTSIFLRIVPRQIWPSGEVVVVGGVTGGTGTIELSAAGLGVSRSIATTNVFHERITVPRTTPLGEYRWTVQSGELAANATLLVDKAPLRIILDHPGRVSPGAGYDVTARLAGPLVAELEGQVLEWSGALAAMTPIADGASRIELVAPLNATRHSGAVAFAGTEAIEATTASFIVRIAEASAPPPGAEQERGFRFEAPPTDFLIAVASLIVLVALAGIIAQRIRTRKRRVSSARESVGPFTLPSGFLAAVAAFIQWLRRLGRAKPGTTAREAAREHPALQPFVEPFEAKRYGGERDEPDLALDQLRRAAEEVEQ